MYLQQSLTRAHTVKQMMCQDAADEGRGGSPAGPLRRPKVGGSTMFTRQRKGHGSPPTIFTTNF